MDATKPHWRRHARIGTFRASCARDSRRAVREWALVRCGNGCPNPATRIRPPRMRGGGSGRTAPQHQLRVAETLSPTAKPSLSDRDRRPSGRGPRAPRRAPSLATDSQSTLAARRRAAPSSLLGLDNVPSAETIMRVHGASRGTGATPVDPTPRYHATRE
eukprot:357854-Chlamydomonas_euryale.AAC.5